MDVAAKGYHVQALKDKDSDVMGILDSRAAAHSKLLHHDLALRDTKQMIKREKGDERVRECVIALYSHGFADGRRDICVVPKPSSWMGSQTRHSKSTHMALGLCPRAIRVVK